LIHWRAWKVVPEWREMARNSWVHDNARLTRHFTMRTASSCPSPGLPALPDQEEITCRESKRKRKKARLCKGGLFDAMTDYVSA